VKAAELKSIMDAARGDVEVLEAMQVVAVHADAMVALLEACEALDDGIERAVSVGQLQHRMRAMQNALAAVHAVGDSTDKKGTL